MARVKEGFIQERELQSHEELEQRVVKKKQAPISVAEKMVSYVETYREKRRTLTAEQIAEMRAELSTYAYEFIDVCRDAEIDSGSLKIDVGKVRGQVYLELFKNYLDQKYSQSAAEKLAGKALECDERVLEVSKQFVEAKAIHNMSVNTLQMVAQVLNSMSYR